MLLFDQSDCIAVCLKNKNPYVALATEDLRNDFRRVSSAAHLPALSASEGEWCIVIEQNRIADADAISDESFSLCLEGNRIYIRAASYLGSMWGIYTLCESVLGVNPCYLFEDWPITRRDTLSIQDLHTEEAPKGFGFRGVFLNDEDLLTGFMDGGGIRFLNYPFYRTTVDPQAMDMVVETVLRLKLNLVIPASFLDIDNPPERKLAERVARRGIYLSQHHLEPLGLSHITFENYCKKRNIEGAYSYFQYPELLEQAWRHYAEKWAEFDHVVWQIGLRGRLDSPVWERDKNPTGEELKHYGQAISHAINRQREIVLQATNGRAKYFTSTLWMEGSRLMHEGCLSLDGNVMMIFADTGPSQLYGEEFFSVERTNKFRYGIYYHVQYWDDGPHLAPQTGLDKLYYNLKMAYDKGDTAYCILNTSNVREFVFELGAYGQMMWNTERFSKEEYLAAYCRRYGKHAPKMEELIRAYFGELPEVEMRYLNGHYSTLFHYTYQNPPKPIKGFAVKEGLLISRAVEIFKSFAADVAMDAPDFYLCPPFYAAVKPVIPKYERICRDLQKIADESDEAQALHIRVKWLLFAQTLLGIYKWFVHLYECKMARDAADAQGARTACKKACEALEVYLEYRKCAEYGKFEHWYRGDIKMNMKKKLLETSQLL